MTGHDGLDAEESVATIGLGPDGLPLPPYAVEGGGLIAPPETNLTEQDMPEESAGGYASHHSVLLLQRSILLPDSVWWLILQMKQLHRCLAVS